MYQQALFHGAGMSQPGRSMFRAPPTGLEKPPPAKAAETAKVVAAKAAAAKVGACIATPDKAGSVLEAKAETPGATTSSDKATETEAKDDAKDGAKPGDGTTRDASDEPPSKKAKADPAVKVESPVGPSTPGPVDPKAKAKASVATVPPPVRPTAPPRRLIMPDCDACEGDEKQKSTVHCVECCANLCDKCNEEAHATKFLKKHTRKDPLPVKPSLIVKPPKANVVPVAGVLKPGPPGGPELRPAAAKPAAGITSEGLTGTGVKVLPPGACDCGRMPLPDDRFCKSCGAPRKVPAMPGRDKKTDEPVAIPAMPGRGHKPPQEAAPAPAGEGNVWDTLVPGSGRWLLLGPIALWRNEIGMQKISSVSAMNQWGTSANWIEVLQWGNLGKRFKVKAQNSGKLETGWVDVAGVTNKMTGQLMLRNIGTPGLVVKPRM